MIQPNQEEIEKIEYYLKENFEKKFKQIQKFIKILLEENKNHNLIGKNTVETIWSRHIIDSLQIMPLIQHDDKNIIDLGSGGGFPGIILSISIEKHFILIEKSPVKAHFLQNVINSLKLNAEVINTKITEQNLSSISNNDNNIITARAFKSMEEILKIVGKNNIKKIILLKGENWEKEIIKASNLIKNWNIKTTNSILDKGIIIMMTKK